MLDVCQLILQDAVNDSGVCMPYTKHILSMFFALQGAAAEEAAEKAAAEKAAAEKAAAEKAALEEAEKVAKQVGSSEGALLVVCCAAAQNSCLGARSNVQPATLLRSTYGAECPSNVAQFLSCLWRVEYTWSST